MAIALTLITLAFGPVVGRNPHSLHDRARGPSIGTDGSNPALSSKESCELRYGRRRPADQVVRRREHKMQRFKSARSAQHEILRWFVYRSRAGLVRRICSSARTVASAGRPRSHARRSAQGRLARGVSTPAPVPHTAGVNRTYLSKLETRAS